MSELTIDHQDVEDRCSHCGETFVVSRGSVYADGEGASIYLAALHHCHGSRVAHVAIAVRAGYEGVGEASAAVFQVRNGGENFEMSVTDPQDSPWHGTDYLGRILTRDEVLSSPLKHVFFHIADHVVVENPTINPYLLD